MEECNSKLHSIMYTQSKDKRMTILDCILFILQDIDGEPRYPMTISEMQFTTNQTGWTCGSSDITYWIQAIKKGIHQNKICKIENEEEKRLYLGRHKYCLPSFKDK